MRGEAQVEQTAEAEADDDAEAKPKVEAKPEGEGEDEQAETDDETAVVGDDVEGEGDTTDEADPTEPQPYTGTPIAELERKHDEAEAKIAEQHKKLMDGELEADAYAAAIKPFQKEQRDLTRQIARAEAKSEAVGDYQMRVIGSIAQQAAKQGLHYAPGSVKDEAGKKLAAKNARMFDALLTDMVSDPDNAGRPFKALAQEAHSAVMAARGIAKARSAPAAEAKPAAAPKGKPPARENGKGPVTLRTVPAASTAHASPGGDALLEAGRALKGQAYESWYSKLSSAQKAKLLDE
jgi:hypothetical protein